MAWIDCPKWLTRFSNADPARRKGTIRRPRTRQLWSLHDFQLHECGGFARPRGIRDQNVSALIGNFYPQRGAGVGAPGTGFARLFAEAAGGRRKTRTNRFGTLPGYLFARKMARWAIADGAR